METISYAALAGQLVLDRRMTEIATNVANAETAGFRAAGVHFRTVLDRSSRLTTMFAGSGEAHAVEAPGGLSRTGNPLDVAIQGQGYIALQTPAGIAYTRDGRMQISPGGELASLNGHAVLDAGGAPISVDPAQGPIQIGRDGMITQNNRQVGAIGLFAVDLSKPFQRYENSGFLPAEAPEPILDFAANGVVQGFVEGANVNPVLEMTRLIDVTRAFEALANALEQNDSAQRSAIQTLGSRS